MRTPESDAKFLEQYIGPAERCSTGMAGAMALAAQTIRDLAAKVASLEAEAKAESRAFCWACGSIDDLRTVCAECDLKDEEMRHEKADAFRAAVIEWLTESFMEEPERLEEMRQRCAATARSVLAGIDASLAAGT